jgi:hypothetical protein
MAKELFDQTLITTPTEPDDNDRIAFGQPSVAGGKNILWSYFKDIVQAIASIFNWVDFTPQVSNPTYQEGRLFYQDSEKTLALYNNRSNTLRQLGRELGDRALNNTGITITNGSVVYVSGDNGTVRTIGLADASDADKALGTIGFATEDILNGEIGEVTFIGKVRDVDTTGCTVAEVLYLSTTPGEFTNVPPESPNYIVFLGNCGRVDAVNGQIDAKIIPRNNTQSVIKIFNGAVLEDTSTAVTSNGTTVTLSYEQNGGGDLSLFFNSGFRAFDATPAATVALTAGTDTAPVLNYVYIPESTTVLTASTSGWPSGQHVPVATVLCQSALGVQTDGVFKMHAWTDHLAGSNEQGHLSHVNFWIRNQNATWLSGIVPTTTIVVNGGAIDNVYFSTTIGTAGVLQLHEHDFPVLNMQTGDPCWIINDFTTKYDRLLDLSSLDTDSEGGTLRSNNTYYSIVIIGIVSEDTADCKYMANAPSGSYSTSAGAINDASGYSNYSIPTDFKGTGFLIARIVLRYQTSASGTLTEELTEDLRGLVPSTSAGGGGSGGGVVTDYSDAEFSVYNSTDPTKILNFLLSGLTTATTRTYSWPDISGLVAVAGMADDFSFGGQAHAGNHVQAFSASTTFDADNGNNQEMIVTASTTIGIQDELPGTYIFTLEIDSVASPTITIGASFGAAVDNNAALINADNDINIITLVVRPNATKYYTINTITA